MPITPAFCGWERGRSHDLPGSPTHTASFQFGERPCHRAVTQNSTEEDTECAPLASARTGMATCVLTYVNLIHKTWWIPRGRRQKEKEREREGEYSIGRVKKKSVSRQMI